MASKFEQKRFSEIDLNDSFFDSLKKDYPEFSDWYRKKAVEARSALVFSDENGLGAFVSLKEENETIPLVNGMLPLKNRLKISTMRLAERYRGQRLGEGALGLCLWEWQKCEAEEIYLTVFDKHDDLIQQLERFGFICVGTNLKGERVYLRSKVSINYSTPYMAFPFIDPSVVGGRYLVINQDYHDTLFPYSELKGERQEQLNIAAANGISKVYIGNPPIVHHQSGELVFIYRKYTGSGKKGYKSCLTSFGVVEKVQKIKESGRALVSFATFCVSVGNKSMFTERELQEKYDRDWNLSVICLLYCGSFGEGNNINYWWLKENGYWPDSYPTNRQFNVGDCRAIFQRGRADIEKIIRR